MWEEKSSRKRENLDPAEETFLTRKAFREHMRQQRKQNAPMRTLFWGLLLILLGLMFLFNGQNWIAWGNLWKVFLVGLGAIFIIQALVSFFTPGERPRTFTRLIPGVILLFNGLAFLLGFDSWWPLALVVTGLVLILGSWFLQREMEKRALTEASLQQSDIKYRHIIDNANSLIMEIDPRGTILFINQFGLDFFGYKMAEILGHSLEGTLVAGTGPGVGDPPSISEDIAVHPEKYLHNEKEYLRRNGEKAWIIWTYKPILDDNRKLKEILCIGIDRTEQKQNEDLIAQQVKAKTALEERSRLARDLHDAVSQTLFSASLIADVLPRVWEKNAEDGRRKLEEVRQLTRGALAEMRTLLFELRPAALADAELGELLRQLSESLMGRARIPATLEIERSCQIPVDVKVAFYRIAQEALNNIARHSRASRAQLTLHCGPGVTLHIIDNGSGFDISREPTGSFGLGNMAERAKQIGALLEIRSKINEGTEISVNWQDPAGEKGL
jgi:PAS domain S-box-containing protein